MLQRSAADWNRGDLDGFMSDYANDSLTSYRDGAHMLYGWQPMYDRYRRNYFAPGKSRDSLSFDEVRVRALTTDLAYATARFKLGIDSRFRHAKLLGGLLAPPCESDTRRQLGKSLDTQTEQKCKSGRFLIEGRAPSSSECPTHIFVTRAMCQ